MRSTSKNFKEGKRKRKKKTGEKKKKTLKELNKMNKPPGVLYLMVSSRKK